ncbi:hypothetical protein DL771_001022 [Monosporascus sp. 5C6A]|nr:hypothetical protein DL771_001022 [Monosporascus sp. 5C6A]
MEDSLPTLKYKLPIPTLIPTLNPLFIEKPAVIQLILSIAICRQSPNKSSEHRAPPFAQYGGSQLSRAGFYAGAASHGSPEGEVSNFINPPNQNAMAIAIMSADRHQRASISLSMSPASSTLYVFLLKSSILVEWLGIFVPGNMYWFFWASWIIIGIQVAFAVAAVIALNLACIPTKKKWEFWLPGKCINAHDIKTVSASFSYHLCLADLDRSACVSAAFRLAVTVQYAEAEDAIYSIGPVCFWASADMTCVFIVVCAIGVPKTLFESGVWRKVKKGRGLSVTGGTSVTPKNRAGSRATRSKNMRSVKNSYLEIDDTELKTLHSESTEHLREPPAKLDEGIVRTTKVTVTHS